MICFKNLYEKNFRTDLRERFVKDFNKNYNNIHVPDYSKFPLFSKIHHNFKGKELRLTEVQKAGIGRQTTKGVGLLAHEVGLGKHCPVFFLCMKQWKEEMRKDHLSQFQMIVF